MFARMDVSHGEAGDAQLIAKLLPQTAPVRKRSDPPHLIFGQFGLGIIRAASVVARRLLIGASRNAATDVFAERYPLEVAGAVVQFVGV